MTKTTEAARKLAERITEQYQVVGSWRKVADCYPPVVTFQTLNRIATTGGEWLPKDKHVLVALGLIRKRKPRTKIQKAIDQMARETRKAVLKRK